MSDNVEMTLGVSLLLEEITEKLLYKVETINGEEVLVDRDIPFRLRYRLNKNRVMLKKDAEVFNQRRLLYLAQYGEPSEDGQNVVIKDEEKMKLFREAISNLVDTPVSHNLMKLNPEDLELVNDCDIKVSPDAMSIFILYFTDDDSLERDLKTEINIIPFKPEESKKEVEEVVDQALVDSLNKEEKVEEKPIEVEKPKKTTRKKKEVPAEPVAEVKKGTKKTNTENILEEKPVLDNVSNEAEKPKKTTRKKKAKENN